MSKQLNPCSKILLEENEAAVTSLHVVIGDLSKVQVNEYGYYSLDFDGIADQLRLIKINLENASRKAREKIQ